LSTKYGREVLLESPEPIPQASTRLDYGALGCGELVVKLFLALRELPADEIVEVHATDPGAVEDFPSWCRLTGNALLAGPTGGDNAYYYIQKKERQA
jgi:tRNA 2-thiouridine synthesizing protein A